MKKSLAPFIALMNTIALCLATTNNTVTVIPAAAWQRNTSTTPASHRRLQGCRKCISFYAHADTNYAKTERLVFPLQVKRIPNDAKFIVHLGDLKGVDDCKSENPYSSVAETYLEHANVPVFLVPGDNDYYDCGSTAKARKRGWKLWEKYFHKFYLKFYNRGPWVNLVDHQMTRTENFAFYKKRILFLGVHLVGGDIKDEQEWNDRLNDNLQWTKVSIDKYSRARAVIIFAHAAPNKKNKYYYDGLSEIANRNKGIDFLYLHGDHHRWKEDRPFDAKNILRVQLDQGAIADPTHIKACSCSNTPTFEFNQRRLSRK